MPKRKLPFKETNSIEQTLRKKPVKEDSEKQENTLPDSPVPVAHDIIIPPALPSEPSQSTQASFYPTRHTLSYRESKTF